MASVDSPSQGSQGEMNFEINLVPFIDILSTCICFLLMTAIWIHIGVFNVSQAIGSEPPAGGKNPPTVIADVRGDGSVRFSLKDLPGAASPAVKDIAPSRRGGIDWTAVSGFVADVSSRNPELKTVLVMPTAKTRYDDVIRLMDVFKTNRIDQIGIAPLSGSGR